MILVEVSHQLEEHLVLSTGRVQDLLPVLGCHPGQLQVSLDLDISLSDIIIYDI